MTGVVIWYLLVRLKALARTTNHNYYITNKKLSPEKNAIPAKKVRLRIDFYASSMPGIIIPVLFLLYWWRYRENIL